MKKFRRKNFTIPEGHYTGPKDMDKVPGVVEMVSKSALGGAGIGAVVGAVMKDSTLLSGAIEGAKYGSITGLILKFFLNYLHNPMSKVKFQDIDRNIRREFGIYRLQGITIGDSVSKRASMDEKFSINDRNVTDYKINFAIQDNQVIMYTFGLTDKELDKVSKILDYYCKKYFGMEYTATAINKKVNAYSVVIVFTNNQVISNFMMELSNEIGYKINLLDNKAIIDKRINDASSDVEEDEKTFSVKLLNKYDLMKIIGESGLKSISSFGKSAASGISSIIQGTITASLKKIGMDKITISGFVPSKRKDFNNIYLESVLKKLRYVEGFHYTVGESKSDVNMSLVSGLFILTASKTSDIIEKLDKTVYDKNKTGINRTDTGKAVVYTYPIVSRNEFEYLIKRLMSNKLTPNIFEG